MKVCLSQCCHPCWWLCPYQLIVHNSPHQHSQHSFLSYLGYCYAIKFKDIVAVACHIHRLTHGRGHPQHSFAWDIATVPLKCYVILAHNFPRVKWLLDRVISGSSGKLRKYSTRYASDVVSWQTMCLLDMWTRKTGSVENSSSIIRGSWDVVVCFQIFYE